MRLKQLVPWLDEFEFLCYQLDPVLVGEPGVLNSLGHEASHVRENREHEWDPNDAKPEAKHPAPEG